MLRPRSNPAESTGSAIGGLPPPPEKVTGGEAAFRDVLRDSGFGRGNLVVDVRHAHGDVARLAAEAESLAASGVDVIVTVGTPPTIAAMQATKRIPIVFNGVGDPVEKGLIASLARPGGNVTGMAVQITGLKPLEFLHEISPLTRRVAVVHNAQNRLEHQAGATFLALVEKRWKKARCGNIHCLGYDSG